MAVIDHPLIIAYEEETRSFPCRLCGHLYYSETELHRHINGFHQEKRRWYFQIVIKNFVNTGISCFTKDIVQVLYENMSLLIAISIDQIVSNNIFLTKVYNLYAFSYFRTKT